MTNNNHRYGRGDRSRPSDRDRPPPGTATDRSAPPSERGSSCIRDALRALSPSRDTHAGLWLDRFLPQQPKTATKDEDKGTIQAHIKRLAHTKVPGPYLQHCERWERHLDTLGTTARVAKATVRGRMIIGLGAESVLETALHLHHTYGVPVIPGSALKGLVASYARNRLTDESWRTKPKEGDSTNFGASHRALFGTTTEAGCVTFHDALWIPQGGEDKGQLPLDLDVMTVHHRGYYGTRGQSPPADSDDPNPVSFVTASGTYLIALEGHPEWTDAAMSLLKRALAEEGIGAKTAAGYGRLDLDYSSPAEEARKAQESAAEEARKAQQHAEEEARKAQQRAAEEARKAQQHAEEEARKAQQRAAEEARKTAARAADLSANLQKLIDKLHAGNARDEVPHICKLAMSLPADQHSHVAQRCIDKLGRDFPKALKASKAWATALNELRSSHP